MFRSTRSRPPSRRPTAFTLVEILVVLVVLAIIAAVVGPYAVGTGDLAAISAARMLACDLQYAQDSAITTQLPVTVTFVASGESYELRNASGVLIHPMSKSAYTVNFSTQRGFGNLDLVSADFGGGPTVTFDELGSPDNGGSVTLQAGPHVYRVDVASATGKVTVTSIGS